MACIEHTYTKNKHGYSQARRNGKKELLHRLAYIDHHQIPIQEIKGKVVMHTCDNPACINPLHLALGDQSDNMRDKSVKGRCHNTILNHWQVEFIRAHYTPGKPGRGNRSEYSYHGLANLFKVSAGTIKQVVKGITFKQY